MTDFATLRQGMVDNQLRTGGVTDRELLRAFLAVPREVFADPTEAPFVYADRDVRMPGGGGAERLMMPAAQLARLIQTLAVAPGAKTMVIGCGSGYSAAILARLADRVVAVEENESLAALARDRLAAHGAEKVLVVPGKLTEGYLAEAPYDAILVDGAVELVPDALIRQLAPDGRLAAIVRQNAVSRATIYERAGDDAGPGWPKFDAWAALLPGFAREREFVF
jgi:protein-L-isoaspartate(D-aspartate) O-methyltransferase